MKRIVSWILVIAMVFSMMPVAIAEESTETTVVTEGELLSETTEETSSDEEPSEGECSEGVPALVYRWVEWDDEGNPYDNETENYTGLRLERWSMHAVRFYYFDGKSYTRVCSEELASSSHALSMWNGGGDFDYIYVSEYVNGSIDYTVDGVTYSISVEAILPDWGFYTTQEPSAESYIERFTVCKASNVFYFVAANGYQISAMELSAELDEIADLSYNEGDSYATITVTGEPPLTGSWYEVSFNVYNESGSCGGGDGLYLYNGPVGLVYRSVDWSGWEGEECRIWSAEKNSSLNVRFYYFDGYTYERVDVDELTVTDGVVSLEADTDNDWVTMTAQTCNEGSVDYTVDDVTYSLPVAVFLPDWGFYSSAEPSDDTYLDSYAVRSEGDVIYLVGPDGYVIDEAIINEQISAYATAEVNGTNYVKIAFTGAPEGWSRCSPYISGTDAQENAFEGYYGYDLYVENRMPKLLFRHAWTDGDGELSESGDMYCWDTSLTDGWSVCFYYFDGDDYHRVGLDELVVTNGIVGIKAVEGEEYFYMRATNVGEGEVQYETDDGTVYSLPVTVCLPAWGYYTTEEPSGESYVEEFTVTEEGQKLYFIVRDGYTISNFELDSSFAAIASAELSEDGVCVTITIHSAPGDGYVYSLHFDGYTPSGNEFTWWGRSIVLYNAVPGLVFGGVCWENGEIREWGWKESRWNTVRGSDLCDIRFYFFDGENYTPVDVDDLVVEGSVSLEWDEEWNCGRMYASGLGEGTISYTEGEVIYSVKVNVTLPDWGVYSEPEASEENHLADGLTVTEENRTAYVVPTDANHTITSVDMDDELAAILEVKIAENGKCVIVNVVDVPEEEGWYSILLSGTYGSDGEFSRYCSLHVKNGMPRLVFRNTWRDGSTGELYQGNNRSSWEMRVGNGMPVCFYFYDGENYIPVGMDELTSTNGMVEFIAEEGEEYFHMFAEKPGEGAIQYRTEAGNVYSVPVVVELPAWGFYTTPEATNDSYVEELAITEEGQQFYFIAREDYTIREFELTGGLGEIATAELSEDGTCVTITIHSSPEDGCWYGLCFDGIYPDGGEFSDWSQSLVLYNALPGLVFGGVYWDNDEICEWGWKGSRWNSVKGDSWGMIRFYFFDGETCTPVDMDDLTVEGAVSLDWEEEWNYGWMVASDFGEGTISYTAEDGVTYSVKVTVSLPDWGFFSGTEVSEESYLDSGFTVKKDSRVFCFANTKGGSISSVTLDEDFDEIADAEIVDGKIVITVTGTPEDGRWYGFSYDGTDTWGYEFAGWSRSVWLENGFPGLVFGGVYWDNDELCESEWKNSAWGTVKGYSRGDIRFYFFDGDTYTPVDVDELVVGDVVSLDWNDEWNYGRMIAEEFGEGTISYTAEDGVTYSVKVTVSLPDWGFFSGTEVSEESYIGSQFAVKKDSRVFCFANTKGGSISSVTLDEDFEKIADAAIVDGKIVFTVTGSPEDDRYYGFIYSGTTAEGYEFSNNRNSIRIESKLPRLVFRNTWRDDSTGELYQGNNRTSWDARMGYSMSACFYYFNGEEYFPVDMDQLTVTNGVVEFVAEEGEDYFRVSTEKPGEGAICYTDGETTYSVKVTVSLPVWSFFSGTEVSEENYLDFQFTVTEENRVFCYASTNGGFISSVTLDEDFEEIADAVIVDGKVVITVTGDPSNGYKYGFTYSGTTAGGSEFSNNGSTIRLTSKIPKLVFGGVYWDNEELCERNWKSTHWDTVKGNSYWNIRFYFFDGDTYTPVCVDELTVEGSVSLDWDNEWNYGKMIAEEFGEGTISYTAEDGTTYSLKVTVGLPNWGFFSGTEVSEESYLDSQFTVKKDSRVFYFANTKGGSISAVTLDEDFEEIADAEIVGGKVVITVTGTPENGRWYGFSYDGTDTWGNVFYNDSDSICLVNGLPGLVFGGVYWDNDELCDWEWKSFQWNTVKGYGWGNIRFYFFDGETYTPVDVDELVVGDVVSLNWNDEWNYGTMIAKEFGEGTISYTTEDGVTYSVKVTVSLPDWGFFSGTEVSEETYLGSQCTVTSENRVFCFANTKGGSISSVTLDEDFEEIADAEIVDGKVVIAVTGTPEDGRWYGFSYDGTNAWGYEFSGARNNIYLKSVLPKLVFRDMSWDGNGVLCEGSHDRTDWSVVKKWGSPVRFYYFNGESYEQVHIGDLEYDSGLITMRQDEDEDFIHMNGIEFGEGTICYTRDGVTYSVDVSVILPNFGFYTSDTPSEETYLCDDYVITEDDYVIYFNALDGCTIDQFYFNWDQGVLSAERNEDGSSIKITLDKETAPEQSLWIYYTGEEHGRVFDDNSWRVGINSALPRLVFRYAWMEESGCVEDNYDQTSWSADPGRAQGRFYLVDGETYTRVYASDLIVVDTEVAYLEDSGDLELSYICATNFGKTTVTYTCPESGKTYSFTISVVLPEIGFYSTIAPAEGSYLRHFVVGKNKNTFYLAGQDGWIIRDVVLMEGLENIAKVEISKDGAYATVTVTGTPEGRWYPVQVYVDSPYGWSDWFYVDIELEAATPKLVYHYIVQDEYGTFIEDEQMHTGDWYNWKGAGNRLSFYFDNGDGSYVPVTMGQLSVSGDAVRLELEEDTGYFFVRAEQFGFGRINYTAEDGAVYSLIVQVGLPPYGFFSAPEHSLENYVEEYAVCGEDDTFYFLVDDSYSIGSFKMDEEMAAVASVEQITKQCLAITVTGNLTDDWYGLKVEMINQEGESFSDVFEINLREQGAYLMGKIYLPKELDDGEFFICLKDELGGQTLVAVNAETIQTDDNGNYVSYGCYSAANFYGCSTSVCFTLVDYQGTLLNSQSHYANIPYVSEDGNLVYGGFYNTPYVQIPADGACELNFTLPTWDEDTSEFFAESEHGVTEMGEYNHTHHTTGAKGYWLHFDPRTDLGRLTINGKLYSLSRLYGKALYVDATATDGVMTIFCEAGNFDAPVFGFAITHIEAVFSESEEDDCYTFRTGGVLGTNWNPHAWETSADYNVLNYVMAPLCDLTIKDSTTGEYQWIFVAATDIIDVTAEHQDDLVKYGCAETDATDGYVYEIHLRPEMCWEDGTPINADTYIYSMQQMLSPELKNGRANTYYSGESAIAGAEAYFFQGSIATIDNGVTGAIIDLNDLVKGEDGVYTTEDGLNVYIALTSGLDWLGGYSLGTYVGIYGDAWFDAAAYDDLYDLADENGNVAITDETWALLTAVISNPSWGEGPGYEGNYIFYEKKYAEASWDSVGLYKVDDYTIRYVCVTAYDYYYFLTACTSNWIVHEELYECCLEHGVPYNGTVATTMSCGPYTVESVDDKTMVLVRNEAYWEYDLDDNGNVVSTTFFEVDGAYMDQFVADRVVITAMSEEDEKESFLAGELDVWSPWADEVVEYATSDRLYQADETYTMRLFFHTNLDSLKAMDAAGNTNSVVLSSDKFRQAMSLAINRAEFVTATAGYKAAYSLLSSLYYYDVYEDPASIYRNTDQAKQAICNLYGVEYGDGTDYATLDEAYASITGYNLEEAKALFTEACAELVAEGLYVAGEPIVIEMGWMAGSMDSTNSRQVGLLNEYMNEALKGTGFGTIELKAVDNLAKRYEDVKNGVYAIGWGAWGGAAFYPFTMFRVYCDPSYVSYIHEGGCWDPASETLTLTINGEEVTMTWQKWSTSMIGTGKYANADNETKLAVLAALEENYLKLCYCIPICSTTACSMLSHKVDYYTDNYSVMYEFGGNRLMSFNYTDAEWADYVQSCDGVLDYGKTEYTGDHMDWNRDFVCDICGSVCDEYKVQLSGDALKYYEILEEVVSDGIFSEETSEVTVNGVTTEVSFWVENLGEFSFAYEGGAQAALNAWLIEAFEAVQVACEAFILDHPEYFWIRNGYTVKPGNPSAQGGVLSGSIKIAFIKQPATDTEEEITDLAAQLASVLKNLVEETSGMSDVEKLAYMDNWLAEHNHYNKDAATSGASDETPWTIVGGLLDAYSPVCEGYARAFQLFCKLWDIPCMLVTGDANGEAHMWTYVYVDGAWYLCDPTWDDPIYNGDTDRDYSTTNYFLVPAQESHLADMNFDIPELATEKYVVEHTFGEWVETKAPTCSEVGEKVRQCVNCGYSESQEIAAKGHTKVKDAAVAATCTKNGLTEGEHCSVCNVVLVAQKEVAATGHSYGSWSVTKAATCTEKGSEKRECSKCDHYETQEIAANGHTKVKDAAVEATCTKTGLTEGEHCSVCGTVIVKQTVVAAKGHSYTDKVTAATCTAKGYTTHTCSCGDSYVDNYVNATGHSYGSWAVTKAATCTGKGSEKRECSKCDHYETHEIAAKGHTKVKDAAVAATCTKTGLTEGEHCSVCNVVLVAQKEVAATGHSYGSWSVTKAATCTGKGSEKRTCSKCNHYETQEIAAKGHTKVKDAAIAATCTKTGLTEGEHCSVCNTVLTAQKEVAAKGHTWLDATYEAPMTCSVCNATKGDPLVRPVDVDKNVEVETSTPEGSDVSHEEAEEAVESVLESAGSVAQPEDTGIEANKEVIEAAKEQVKDENGRAVDSEKIDSYDTSLKITMQEAVVDKQGDNVVAKRVSYDITPYLYALDEDGAVLGQAELNNFDTEITFRLPIHKDTTSSVARVWHNDEELEPHEILVDENGNKYIEVKTKSFSVFTTEIHDHAYAESSTAFQWTADFGCATVDYACTECSHSGTAECTVTCEVVNGALVFTAGCQNNKDGMNLTSTQTIRIVTNGTKRVLCLSLYGEETAAHMKMMVAAYSANGRLTGVQFVDPIAAETDITVNGDVIKVFFLDPETNTPLWANLG